MPQVQKRLFASSIKNGGLPNITGRLGIVGGGGSGWFGSGSALGAFQYGTSTTGGFFASQGSDKIYKQFEFDASRVSATYDSGTTVRPAAVYTNWCVKF